MADALNRAIRNAWRGIDSGALRGRTVDDLHRLPETAATYVPHGLPHGEEVARVAKLARQGDRLAAAEVRASLARSRTQHGPVVRGIDCEAAPKRGRPPQTRLDEVLARFLYDEITAGVPYEKAVAHAGEMFFTAYGKRGDGAVREHRALTMKRMERIVRDLLKGNDPV